MSTSSAEPDAVEEPGPQPTADDPSTWRRGSGDSGEGLDTDSFRRSSSSTAAHAWGAARTGAHEVASATLEEPVPPLLTALCVGAVAAVVSVFLPWGYAHLLDDANVLLTHTSTGRDPLYPGTLVIVLGAVALLLGVALIVRPTWRLLTAPAAVCGAAIAILAITARHDNSPRVEHLKHIRPGTFQYGHLSVEGVVGYGLWIGLAAGVAVLVTAVAWFVRSARTRPAR